MIIHYRARDIFLHDLPGMRKFRGYFRAYGATPVDRSGVICLPVRTKSLFPLPAMLSFGKSYEQVCDERALELLNRAEGLDVQLYAFWSGGIDSTCVLVSLLKQATPSQRERIAVLMSEASISEYPDFYKKHIRGHLRCQPAATFPYLLGTRNLLVSGEHNDQLFGSDVIADAIKRFGFDAVMAPYDRKLFTAFFTDKMDEDAVWYVGLFERLKDRAPIVLKSNYDLFWWLNFTLKWQHVFMRMLSFGRNLNESYVRDYYAPFFNTEDFQLWSMNNLDRRVKNSWRHYKWPAKDVIYNYTKDATYRDNKLKLGSLQFLIRRREPAAFIDEGFAFHTTMSPDVFYDETVGRAWN